MGQRSQIYVAFNMGDRNDDGSLKVRCTEFLIARYYQWNYGSRMISRARGLIEWIDAYKRFLDFRYDRIPYIADVNFDLRDVALGQDIIKEYAEGYYDEEEEIFLGQDNNDGKLFIRIEDNGVIKYCFTGYGDYECIKPLDCKGYMNSQFDEDPYSPDYSPYETEIEHGSNYFENAKYISEHAVLMTEKELDKFINGHYANVAEVTRKLARKRDKANK